MIKHLKRCEMCFNVDCALYRNRWNRSDRRVIWEYGCASCNDGKMTIDDILEELENWGDDNLTGYFGQDMANVYLHSKIDELRKRMKGEK